MGRAPCHRSQSRPGGIGSPEGNPSIFQPCQRRSLFMNITIFVTSAMMPASLQALNWK